MSGAMRRRRRRGTRSKPTSRICGGLSATIGSKDVRPATCLLLISSELDAARFEGLLRSAKRSLTVDPSVTVAAIDDALSLWRGPALADLADQHALLAQAARLDELRLSAQETRIEALMAAGSSATAVAELEPLLAANPLRESFWGLMMLALYREGRQADALSAYRKAHEVLIDELGIEPSPELQKLHGRLLEQDPSLELRGAGLRGYRLLEQIGESPDGVMLPRDSATRRARRGDQGVQRVTSRTMLLSHNVST